MSKINESVKHLLDRIAEIQQNIAALYRINYSMSCMRQFTDEEGLKEASNMYCSVLHRQLAEAWNHLAYMAPVSKEAMQYLSDRTKTWFRKENASIMGFLGHDGAYFTRDEEQFRKEVLDMFGVEEDGNDI